MSGVHAAQDTAAKYWTPSYRWAAWGAAAFYSLAAIYGVWLSSGPEYGSIDGLLFVGVAFYLGIPVALIWTVAIAVRSISRRSFPALRDLAPWLTALAAGLIAIGIVSSGVAFTARFDLSRGAMDRFAKEVVAAPRGTTFSNRWVGLYHASSIQSFPGGGMRFLAGSDGFLDDEGFAYSPRGEPPMLGEYSYTHLSGPWYYWHQSW